MFLFKKDILILLLVIFFPFNSLSNNYYINNFNKAKIISAKINYDGPGSFYCGCRILWKGKKGIPDLESCGYKIRKNIVRANRIEWEHVVPAWEFGHQLKCWQLGGRKQCKKDPIYRKMESDLHNLQPAIGEINADRGNYHYSDWQDCNSQYGLCKMKIDFKKKQANPPIRARGIIARTYFYMRDKYKLRLSKAQTMLFEQWNLKYPANEWECKRNLRIASIQGDANFYVLKSCSINN